MDLILPLFYFLALSSCAMGAKDNLSFSIETEWNGVNVDHAPINITFTLSPKGELEVSMEAPYFDSLNPDTLLVQQETCPQRPAEGIFDYEVVEVFFLNDEDEYLEMELAPNGQYLNILLSGSRNDLLRYLPLNGNQVEVNNPCKDSSEPECVWTGKVTVPTSYLPKNITKFNAFAVHGEMEEGQRVTHYEALFPVNEQDSGLTEPNFHYLEAFRPVDFGIIGLSNSEESELWTQAKTDPQSFSSTFNLVDAYDCNSTKRDHGATIVTTRQNGAMGFRVNVSDYNDVRPDIPVSQQNAGPNDELFDSPHESVWASFTNDENKILRIGVNLYGSYLINLMDGTEILTQITLSEETPIICSSNLEKNRWSCNLALEDKYFPKDVKYFQLVHHHKPLLSDDNIPLPDFEVISASCLGTLEENLNGKAIPGVDWIGCLTDNRMFLDPIVNSEYSELWSNLLTGGSTSNSVPTSTENTETNECSIAKVTTSVLGLVFVNILYNLINSLQK